MARSNYSHDKRQREVDRARKKREKAERRAERREAGPAADQVVSVAEMVGDAPSAAEAMRAMAARAETPRAARGVPCRLFVGGLSWDTSAEMLRGVFGEFGTISDATILVDRATGRSRGFGFVTFENRRDAARAVEQLDGSELDGRRIVVNVATSR